MPHEHLLWAWSGFWRLSNVRPQGFNGPLRIPFVEIEAYCRLQGWRRHKVLDFIFFLERMDDVFMNYVIEQQEKEDQKRGKGPKAPPKPKKK